MTLEGSALIYSDAGLRDIFGRTKTIAVVGASPRWMRPSHSVIKYMQDKGYRVIPVNPHEAGREILGQPVYARLADIPVPVQMVDVFRASAAAGEIVYQAIALKDQLGILCVWLQIGVRDDDAAGRARAAGLTVVMNRCVKIDYGRLFA